MTFEEGTLGSLTESVTVLMPDKKNIKKIESFQRLDSGEEPEEAVEFRKKLLRTEWERCKKGIDDVLVEMHKDAVQSIVDFVGFDHRKTSGTVFSEIPTGILLSGINNSDDDMLYAQIRRSVQDSGHHIVTLRSSDAPNLKAAMKFINESIFEQNEEGDESLKDVIKEFKSAPYDPFLLDLWSNIEMKKKTVDDNSQTKLALLIPDFEWFDGSVLEELIMVFSQKMSTLSFVFLFGMATSVDLLHDMLSKAAICMLNIQTFRLQHVNACMNAIVEEVFLSRNNCLRLSHRAYSQLLDNFHLINYSIGAFVAGLQYAYMSHFYANPLSILTTISSETFLENRDCFRQYFTPTSLLRIRMLKSFQSYVEDLKENDEDAAIGLVENDDALFNALPEFLRGVEEFHHRQRVGISIIFRLQSCFNTPSLQMPIRTLFREYLQGQICDREHVKTLLMLIKNLNPKTLYDFIVFVEEQIKDFGGNVYITYPEKNGKATLLEEAIKRKEDIKEYLPSESCSESDDEDAEYVVKKGLKRARQELRQSRTTKVSKILRPLHETTLNEDSWDGAISRVTFFFKSLFSECLKHYSEVPLAECMYYSDANFLLRKAFIPNPRSIIQSALNTSGKYLGCDCCSKISDVEMIHGNLEDAAIAYKLYLECGKLVNLYDWFMAFKAIIESKEKNVDATQVQARFFRIAAEMQFMGFVKPTKRKTDHVMRLIW